MTIHSENISTAAGEAKLSIFKPRRNIWRISCHNESGFVLAFCDFAFEDDAWQYLPVLRERIAEAKQFPL